MDANGVPTFLPTRSFQPLMPEPLRETNWSDAAISSRMYTKRRSWPWLVAVASGLEPTSPICTSPELMALITSPPPPNMRQLIL